MSTAGVLGTAAVAALAGLLVAFPFARFGWCWLTRLIDNVRGQTVERILGGLFADAEPPPRARRGAWLPLVQGRRDPGLALPRDFDRDELKALLMGALRRDAHACRAGEQAGALTS